MSGCGTTPRCWSSARPSGLEVKPHTALTGACVLVTQRGHRVGSGLRLPFLLIESASGQVRFFAHSRGDRGGSLSVVSPAR
jgi:hypothetical protein